MMCLHATTCCITLLGLKMKLTLLDYFESLNLKLAYVKKYIIELVKNPWIKHELKVERNLEISASEGKNKGTFNELQVNMSFLFFVILDM
jgi:hypothetical protein